MEHDNALAPHLLASLLFGVLNEGMSELKQFIAKNKVTDTQTPASPPSCSIVPDVGYLFSKKAPQRSLFAVEIKALGWPTRGRLPWSSSHTHGFAISPVYTPLIFPVPLPAFVCSSSMFIALRKCYSILLFDLAVLYDDRILAYCLSGFLHLFLTGCDLCMMYEPFFLELDLLSWEITALSLCAVQKHYRTIWPLQTQRRTMLSIPFFSFKEIDLTPMSSWLITWWVG